MKYLIYQDYQGRKVKEEGAMVVIEHYDLDSLAVRKLSNGEIDDTWTFETPVPWSHSDLPDLELVSETEFTEVGGDRRYRWKLRHKDMGRRV